jgi:hypothetical protein
LFTGRALATVSVTGVDAATTAALGAPVADGNPTTGTACAVPTKASINMARNVEKTKILAGTGCMVVSFLRIMVLSGSHSIR